MDAHRNRSRGGEARCGPHFSSTRLRYALRQSSIDGQSGDTRIRGGRQTTYSRLEDVPTIVDRDRMIKDLKRIVETAGRLMGDIDYTHYAFLMMGRGAGGIEHSNSSANSFNGNSLTTPAGYLSWLSFIAHEYFHSYNVKRIRPLAL